MGSTEAGSARYFSRNLAGLGEDGGIFAVVAEDAEELERNSRVLVESLAEGAPSFAYSRRKGVRIQAESAAFSSGVAATRS